MNTSLKNSPAHLHERGLTLIEIMVVITILGILMTIVGVNVIDQMVQAKIDTTRLEIGNIETSLSMFKIKLGRYPTTSEGLDALLNPPTGNNGQTYQPFLDGTGVPTDAWNNPYMYFAPAQGCQKEYEIRSLGNDSSEGGTGRDADISSCDGAGS